MGYHGNSYIVQVQDTLTELHSQFHPATFSFSHPRASLPSACLQLWMWGLFFTVKSSLAQTFNYSNRSWTSNILTSGLSTFNWFSAENHVSHCCYRGENDTNGMKNCFAALSHLTMLKKTVTFVRGGASCGLISPIYLIVNVWSQPSSQSLTKCLSLKHWLTCWCLDVLGFACMSRPFSGSFLS